MVNADNRVEAWWSKEWGLEELGGVQDDVDDEVEDEVEALSPPTMWEAEVAALSDEQLAAMEETAEDL